MSFKTYEVVSSDNKFDATILQQNKRNASP